MNMREFFRLNAAYGVTLPGADQLGYALLLGGNIRSLRLETQRSGRRRELVWSRAYEIRNLYVMNGILVIQFREFTDLFESDCTVMTVDNPALLEHPNHLMHPQRRENLRIETGADDTIELQIGRETYILRKRY